MTWLILVTCGQFAMRFGRNFGRAPMIDRILFHIPLRKFYPTPLNLP